MKVTYHRWLSLSLCLEKPVITGLSGICAFLMATSRHSSASPNPHRLSISVPQPQNPAPPPSMGAHFAAALFAMDNRPTLQMHPHPYRHESASRRIVHGWRFFRFLVHLLMSHGTAVCVKTNFSRCFCPLC